MKRIGIVANSGKPDALQLASELADWLAARKVEVLIERESAELVNRPDVAADAEMIASSDFVVVLGGDGTILRAARMVGPKRTPILGVHFGQYGFITEIHPPNLESAMERALAGDFLISDRLMLNASLIRGGKELAQYSALNDVVVAKGPLARLLSLSIYVHDKYIATYASDGIIVSTPTGSTAYSLSAGGPVVNPNVDVMLITPICPHTLNARSLVIPGSESVQIVAECDRDESSMMLTTDGQTGVPLQCSDKVNVARAEYPARIIIWDPLSFYDKLQSRLRWGERFSE
ncbi:MAG: NAD(+)/NADH kinase [Armatimonadota bacterium]|nr:NAD(+)/NADH kinase [Armatimonadota bacterium]